MFENFRSFEHFHHKRAPVSEQIVLGAYPREQPIHNPYRGPVRWNERTGLGEYCDQCGLAKQSRLPSHVRTGDDM